MVTCRNEARTRSVAVLFESTFEPVGRRWWQPSLSPNPQVTTYPLEKILSTTKHGIFFTTEKRVKTSTFASRAHSRETRGAREGLSKSRRRTLATGMDNASPIDCRAVSTVPASATACSLICGAREGLSTSRRRTLATGILPSAPSGMDNASPSWLRCPRTPAFGMWTTPRSPNNWKLGFLNLPAPAVRYPTLWGIFDWSS